MKLTKTANTKIKPGMTLIEITVVILVLLTLISVLFIGANIYKRGADRAACILNIRNVHQAVRAHQNLNARNVGDDLDFAAEIYSVGAVEAVEGVDAVDEIPESSPGAGDGSPAVEGVDAVEGVAAQENYLTRPICPTQGGDYTDESLFPEVGLAAIVCDEFGATGSEENRRHFPQTTAGW